MDPLCPPSGRPPAAAGHAASAGLLAHPLLRRLICLGLDGHDFAIFGSGPLLAWGLRCDIGDLDIVARGSAWERARTIGVPRSGGISGDPTMHLWGGRIEVYARWFAPLQDTDELIDGADLIGGLRFVRLEYVLAYKRELGRPKDLVDIRAMEGLAPAR
jgi:hypothetical protein